jgi:hypothetical protein
MMPGAAINVGRNSASNVGRNWLQGLESRISTSSVTGNWVFMVARCIFEKGKVDCHDGALGRLII